MFQHVKSLSFLDTDKARLGLNHTANQDRLLVQEWTCMFFKKKKKRKNAQGIYQIDELHPHYINERTDKRERSSLKEANLTLKRKFSPPPIV